MLHMSFAHLNVSFMHPRFFFVGVPLTLGLFALLGYYNALALESLRRYYAPAGMVLLNIFSPRNYKQTGSVWAHWALATALLVTAAAMPYGNFAPELARKGALQVEFVVQVNNAMADESDRKYHPEGDPGMMFQYDSRLDMVKRFIDNDFLPELKGNETGVTTFEGLGYNMWDLTADNQSPNSAFRIMLDTYTQVGAAPGAGANISSGLDSAMQEFDLITKLDKQSGDSAAKTRFIVLFTDGNDTSDPQALASAEAELSKRHIHLLIVGLGETYPVSVPTYDATTHERNGAYDGQTSYQPKVLAAIQQAVPGADLIYAPPGTEHVNYDFPQKAGGLYAEPHQSNLYAWLVAAALLVVLNLTIAGGRLPRLRYAAELIGEAVDYVRFKK